MRVVIVCGAGASSSFIATRMRRAAALRGLDVEVLPRSEAMFESELAGVDVVLLGSHLAAHAPALRERIAGAAPVAVLPAELAGLPGGDGALDLALAAAAQHRAPPDTHPPEKS